MDQYVASPMPTKWSLYLFQMSSCDNKHTFSM